MDSDWSEYVKGRRDVTLVGGFRCAMTNAERNQWHAHCESLPEYAQLKAWARAVQILKLKVGSGAEVGNELLEAMQSFDAIHVKLFGIGERWFAELQQRRTTD